MNLRIITKNHAADSKISFLITYIRGYILDLVFRFSECLNLVLQND